MRDVDLPGEASALSASDAGKAFNALAISSGIAGVVGKWSPSGWKPFSSAMYLKLEKLDSWKQ